MKVKEKQGKESTKKNVHIVIYLVLFISVTLNIAIFLNHQKQKKELFFSCYRDLQNISQILDNTVVAIEENDGWIQYDLQLLEMECRVADMRVSELQKPLLTIHNHRESICFNSLYNLVAISGENKDISAIQHYKKIVDELTEDLSNYSMRRTQEVGLNLDYSFPIRELEEKYKKASDRLGI